MLKYFVTEKKQLFYNFKLEKVSKTWILMFRMFPFTICLVFWQRKLSSLELVC
jgi:ABC-type methionine transport system permease subunit